MAQMSTKGVSLENPLFLAYAFYCSLLIVKMMFMTIYTIVTRHKAKVYISSEDVTMFKGKVKHDDKVERIRRAHLNDLESIPIFIIISLVYIMTNPSYSLAVTLFRAYTFARFIHTFVYTIVIIPQPSRFIAFQVGFWITGYMAVHNAIYFWR